MVGKCVARIESADIQSLGALPVAFLCMITVDDRCLTCVCLFSNYRCLQDLILSVHILIYLRIPVVL